MPRQLPALLILFCLFAGHGLRAAVVYSGLRDIPISTGFEGTYLNVTSGASGGSMVLGWHVNFFFGGAGIWNQSGFQPLRSSTDPFSPILNLPTGTVIDGTSLFASGEGGSGDLGSEHLGSGNGFFQPGQLGIFGFNINIDGAQRYGWMRVILTADESGALIQDWAYDDTGAPILAGLLGMAIPEPNRTLLLLGGILSIGLRRSRKRVSKRVSPAHPQAGLMTLSLLLFFCLLAAPTMALDQNQDGVSDVFAARVIGQTSNTENPATRDLDGDGATDLTEFLFGTDPKSASSVPLHKPRFDPSGVYKLNSTVIGATYSLESSSDLRTWTTAIAPVVATETSLTFTVTPLPRLRPVTFVRFSVPTSQPDGDGDGLNVLEEALFGTSDAAADVDGDGYNDAEEFTRGFDPFTPNNSAPSVAFVSAPGALFDLGSLQSLQVTAHDPDAGDNVSLSLYEGTNQVGSSINAGSGGTFDFGSIQASAGPHIYLAKATDSRGKSSWAAIPIYVRQPPSNNETYGPIEGGMRFTVAASSSDLRSNPFLRQPLFAGAVGVVTGDTLSFNEQPNWHHGAFSTGHFVYVRSGSRLGSILRISGNDANSLTLDSATHGVVTGDLISIVPQWTLDGMIPSEVVHATTSVHLAESEFTLPNASVSYRRLNGIGWARSTETTAETVLLPPWGTFSIRHAAGTSPTSLRLLGDIATGTRRIMIPASERADGFTISPIAFQPMSLNESGLKDSFFVRNGMDFVDVVAPGGATARWQLIEKNWLPSSGTDDGSTPVILPGGAMIIGRSDPFTSDTTWLQPFGK